VIDTKMVPTSRVGTAYSASLAATGGAGTLTWSLASGSLPAGLSLSAAGVISGTPSAAAAVRVQVRVTDAKGRARTRPLFVQVLGASTDAWNAEGSDYSRDSWNPGETIVGRSTAAQLGYRWKTAIAAGTEASLVADRTPVVIGSRVYDVDLIGRLGAWNTGGTSKTVTPAWSYTATGDGIYYPDSPTESGGVLYIRDSSNYLDAIRASDGVRLWHVDVGSRTTLRNELLVQGGKILLQDENYDLRAFNTSDGSPAWGGAVVTLDGNEASGAIVLPTDGTRAFVLANCEVKAVTIATGAVAWTVPVKAGGSTNCGTVTRHTPMYADGAVFASTYDGSIAIEGATGVVRWRTGTKGGYAAGGGAIANGVWVLDSGAYDDPNLVALSLATGEILWTQPDAGPSEGFAIAGDLIVGRGTYTLTGYDLLTGEKLWDGGTPDTSAYTNGAPAIAGGRIYVSTRDGVKAYGLP
jgi:outer membrane protein assembly factor BamB